MTGWLLESDGVDGTPRRAVQEAGQGREDLASSAEWKEEEVVRPTSAWWAG